MQITKKVFDKTLISGVCAALGFFVIHTTQTLGIDVLELSGGIVSGLSPFVWNWVDEFNKRLGTNEALVIEKIAIFNEKLEKITIGLGDFATEDELETVRTESFAGKATAQQASNNAYLALEQSKTNQTRINNLLSDGGLLRIVELVTKTELRLSILEKKVDTLLTSIQQGQKS